jgi:hypothetical protein
MIFAKTLSVVATADQRWASGRELLVMAKLGSSVAAPHEKRISWFLSCVARSLMQQMMQRITFVKIG